MGFNSGFKGLIEPLSKLETNKYLVVIQQKPDI